MNALTQDRIKQQLNIGIVYFLQGYVTEHLVDLQNLYLKQDVLDLYASVEHMWILCNNMDQAMCLYKWKIDSDIRTKNHWELLKVIQDHLTWTKYSPDHEIKQQHGNIKWSMGNTNIASLQTWLRMICTVKETTMQDKNQEWLRDLYFQSITRFLVRQQAY